MSRIAVPYDVWVRLYHMVRPLLFKLDPEQAHNLVFKLLAKGIAPHFDNAPDPILKTTLCGLSWPNPVGLAAGFDKQAHAVTEMFGFGFGAIELGTITPEPQGGNPKPRLFRVPEMEAIINRFGFNSDGFDTCLRRIIAHRDATPKNKRLGPLGINIGKNKDTVDAVADYVSGVWIFASYADYLTINISSPNTPGLRDLQGRQALTDLLRPVVAARNDVPRKPPLFVKIAPDQTNAQMEDIAAVALESGIDGLIIGNTTLSRPKQMPSRLAQEAGGLSGAPLRDMSTALLARMYKLTGGKLSLIGCGGIASGADAYAKIRAGASVVQLYTALIYHGPGLVPMINRDLARLLKRDGFSSVAEAVGVDVK